MSSSNESCEEGYIRLLMESVAGWTGGSPQSDRTGRSPQRDRTGRSPQSNREHIHHVVVFWTMTHQTRNRVYPCGKLEDLVGV